MTLVLAMQNKNLTWGQAYLLFLLLLYSRKCGQENLNTNTEDARDVS